MTTLEQNLQTILNEKTTKIIPENIKKGVQIFDITGALETSTSGGVKLFKTKEEMNSSTGNTEGDLAVIYRNQNTFDGIYIYKNNNWELAPTQLTATPDHVYQQSFYSKNGVESGALAQNISNSFNDINAEVYNKIQTQYDNMTPRILTDSDKSIDGSIYFIPAKRDGTPLLDTSNVTDMSHMFDHYSNLATISLLDTSNVTNMSWMFYRCSNLATIPLLDTSNVTNMEGMLNACSNLATIPLLDTNNVTNMSWMFYNCSNLATIPLLDTSNVTNMSWMFYNCSSLTTIPLLNTSKVTDMLGMFHSCTNLTTIPLLNTSNVTNMSWMFYYSSLTTIPLLDTSNVTDMSHMFDHCSNLATIPLLDTSNVTNMSCMFYNCSSLTTIPLLNTSKVTDMEGMFEGCSSLSDDSLNIIMQMCINATSYTGTKALKAIGLTSEQADKCKTLSNYSAFTSAGWTTGY